MKFTDVYPQLPVIRQEGNYHIKDKDEQRVDDERQQTLREVKKSIDKFRWDLDKFTSLKVEKC